MCADLHEWFARRTFRADCFDVSDLCARKQALGLRVSAVLPARNEAETVQAVVRAVAGLRGDLVDEVIVIDSASDDQTVRLATEAGAVVHHGADLLPAYGPVQGKGDALWRGLSVASGDLVVFIDTDITNPDPRFVYGLLGPLLVEPQVQLVKAFYDRPVRIDKILYPAGGGRVTELLARPLLNMFWPDLAGLVQPLAGEYAGRRDLLETIPFFTGYGVELGMLIDTLEATGAGVEAIAQVDLFERVHRNQPVDALSRMAFGITHVAMRRLVERGYTGLGDLPTSYTQFGRVDGHVQPLAGQVEILERPPLRSLRPAD